MLVLEHLLTGIRSKLRAPAPDVSDEAGQKSLIEELVNAKEEYVRRLESLKLSSHPTQHMPNIDSWAAPAHTGGNVVPTQHSLNPLARAASENAPAPQWPLPNIPASYPIAPMNPVTVQSDQYNSRPLWVHFDILVARLVREIYSSEYQIPVGSRSNFTGAIRETHRLEVIEAERRESTWSATSSLLIPEASHKPYGARMLSMSSGYSRHKASVTGKQLELEWKESSPIIHNTSSDAHGQKDQRMVATGMKAGLSLEPSVAKPDKNDVVDELVRLWTLVR